MELSKQKIMRLLREHADLLRQYRVKKIGLFGSYARGDHKPGSDIDFLVEFDLSAFDENFSGYYRNYLGLRSSLGEIFPSKVDLLTGDMISPHIEPPKANEVYYFISASIIK